VRGGAGPTTAPTREARKSRRSKRLRRSGYAVGAECARGWQAGGCARVSVAAHTWPPISAYMHNINTHHAGGGVASLVLQQVRVDLVVTLHLGGAPIVAAVASQNTRMG
jgi:hypothetical protein